MPTPNEMQAKRKTKTLTDSRRLTSLFGQGKLLFIKESEKQFRIEWNIQEKYSYPETNCFRWTNIRNCKNRSVLTKKLREVVR